MTYNYLEWLKNPYKIFCKCKCGTEIIVKPQHKYCGIPEYICGHNNKNIMHESYKNWIENGSPKIYCGCPCHQGIIIQKNHKYRGIPKYILGHHPHSNKGKGKIHESYERWIKEGQPKIFCECKCENEIIIKEYYKEHGIPKYIHGHNKPHKGKTFDEQYRKKLSDSHIGQIGDKSSNWRGGITPVVRMIRYSNEYYEWRLQIFGRDNFTCQSCGVRGIYLEAHHIKSFSKIITEYNIKNIQDALNCNLLWDLNNGITYCLECHNKLKKKGGLLEK